MNNTPPLQLGDTVQVRQGFIDPETNVDMSGWHGRITEFYPSEGTAFILFDAQTLRAIPPRYINQCEADGNGWNGYGYDLTDLIKAAPRATLAQTAKVLAELEYQHKYDHLGEEGLEIQQIIRTADPEDEMDHLDAWQLYLKEHLTCPFEAVISEFQRRGPLQLDDKVMVRVIEEANESYGVLAEIQHGRKRYDFPLAYLLPTDEKSSNYDLISLYQLWYAHR